MNLMVLGNQNAIYKPLRPNLSATISILQASNLFWGVPLPGGRGGPSGSGPQIAVLSGLALVPENSLPLHALDIGKPKICTTALYSSAKLETLKSDFFFLSTELRPELNSPG